MAKMGTAYKVSVRKPEVKKPLGRMCIEGRYSGFF
jgi:hypothetical protein